MTNYQTLINQVLDVIDKGPDTSGGRTLRALVNDLEGPGAIGGIMHKLDSTNFELVINLLQEFRRSGRFEGFNSIHAQARNRISKLPQLEK